MENVKSGYLQKNTKRHIGSGNKQPNMILIIFLFIISLLLYIQYKKEGRWINIVSILAGLYLLLVALNNIFIHRLGFFLISDKVLLMLLCGIICFYIGTIFVNNKKQGQVIEEDNLKKLKAYHIKAMTITLYIIALIGLIKVKSLITSGAFSAINIDDAEGIMGNGIVGHLLNLSYSICPIVFLYWTYYPKKILYLLPIILLIIITFSTLIKYNIIGFFVILFMFTMIYRKSLLRKALFTLVIFVTVIFISNYAFTFAMKEVEVESAFYYNHLWKYCSGSIIYDNYIFSLGIRPETNLAYKILTFIFALPNMFLGKLYDVTYFQHEAQQHLPVHNEGETSNVVDAIGYIFPSNGNALEVICFCIVLIIIGFISALIYKKGITQSNKLHTYLAIYLTYFVFFSFFGTFYIVSGPWEILVYSLLIPSLFYKKTRICK